MRNTIISALTINLQNTIHPCPSDMILTHFFFMIIDQEESCFKQYSFSKRYWVSPGGGMKLLSKNDRYTQVVSAFYSYSFRFGIDLNEEEMKNK